MKRLKKRGRSSRNNYFMMRIYLKLIMKRVCLLANSRSADIMGSRVMRAVRSVGGEGVEFFGYGGPWMEREGGFSSEMDISAFTHKDFVTYRKARPINKFTYFRYSPLNLVNAHFTRNADLVLERVRLALTSPSSKK